MKKVVLFLQKPIYKSIKIWHILVVLILLINIYQKEAENQNKLIENKKTLIVVSDDNHTTEQVTEKDSRVSDIWEDGQTFIINNSQETIYLELVVYTTATEESPIDTTVEHSINSNTSYASAVNIDYVFTVPPYSVTIYHGAHTTFNYHLHR